MEFLPLTKEEEKNLLSKRSLLIKNDKSNRKNLHLGFFAGFIMSDGSFQVQIQKDSTMANGYAIRCQCNVTQSTKHNKNVDFLDRLKGSLEKNYPPIKVGSNKTGKEALRIFVQGANNFKNFKKYLNKVTILTIKGKTIIPFVGLRYRDYLILECIENLRSKNELNSDEGLITAIRLRYSLHCTNASEMLQKNKIRPSFEERLYTVGETLGRGQAFLDIFKRIEPKVLLLLSDIDNQYQNHEKNIREAIATETLKINPWFITGFYDGDGGHSAILQFRAYQKLEYKCISYTYAFMPNKLILEIVDYYFKKQLICNWPGNTQYKNYINNYSKDYYQLKYQSSQVLKSVIFPHFQRFPLQTIKVEALNTCYDIITKRESNMLLDVDSNILAIKEIYATPTTHGAEKRRIDLNLVINYVLYFFGVTKEEFKISLPDEIDISPEMDVSSGIEDNI